MGSAPQGWRQWNPGLDNADKTLREVLGTLPGNKQLEISPIIRAFENPKSPIAFSGAISLARHDLVHIVLGRGLLSQDEAFVIGFTMGTSKRISRLESWIFQKITKFLYPRPYNFNDNDLKAFRLGLWEGEKSDVMEIFNMPIEDYMDTPLKTIREMVGLDVEHLRKVYKYERMLLPNTEVSNRLPN